MPGYLTVTYSSLSQNLWQLAISRAFVGLGAAGLDLLVLIIINGMPPSIFKSNAVDTDILSQIWLTFTLYPYGGP